MNSNAMRRRRLSAIIAVLLVLAMILSGTFAWNYYRDHRTNEADAGNLKYKARLVETYDPNSTKDWKVTDADVTKIIKVYNPGAETEFDNNVYGDIFVRIQLKEFMEFYPTNEIYSADRYMIDTDGRFISFIDQATAVSWVETNLHTPYNNEPHVMEQMRMYSTPFKTNSYANNQGSIDRYIAQYNNLPAIKDNDDKKLNITKLTVDGDGDTLDPEKFFINPTHGLDDDDLPWYIQTKESDPNGIYGAFMLLDLSTDRNNPQPLVEGMENMRDSQRKAGDGGHHDDLIDSATTVELNYGLPHENGECGYTVHTWEKGLEIFTYADWAIDGMTFDRFVQWKYGPDVMTYSAWQSSGKPMNKWVVDDRIDSSDKPVCPDGWVYWIGSLAPKQYSSDFLRSISLLRQPDDAFYYAIHTDMQAVSFSELDRWTEAPADLIDVIVKSFAKVTKVTVSPANIVVKQGDTQMFSATVIGNVALISQDVDWVIDDIFSGSFIDASGQLTVGTTQAVNSQIIVKAISKLDNTVYGTAIVTVAAEQQIDLSKSVFAPTSATLVRQVMGSTTYSNSQEFTVTWNTEEESPISNQNTVWKVEAFPGQTLKSGTKIISLGINNGEATANLTIDPTETCEYVKVIAESVYDSAKKFETTVFILQARRVTVDNTENSVNKNSTDFDLGLTAKVASQMPNIDVPGGVTWSIDSGSIDPAGAGGVSINPTTGLVTVAIDSDVNKFKVKATSVYNTAVSALSDEIEVKYVPGWNVAEGQSFTDKPYTWTVIKDNTDGKGDNSNTKLILVDGLYGFGPYGGSGFTLLENTGHQESWHFALSNAVSPELFAMKVPYAYSRSPGTEQGWTSWNTSWTYDMSDGDALTIPDLLNTTSNYLFLLSVSEVNHYSDHFEKSITDSRGWWLRSPGNDISTPISYVTPAGVVSTSSSGTIRVFRVAMWISYN